MALKEYKLVRPADEAEFTMMLNEDDKAKYEKAKWKVTETRRKVNVTPKDLSAPKTPRATKDTTDADADAGAATE